MFGMIFALNDPAYASCVPPQMDVQTGVQLNPLTIREDFTTQELSALAKAAAQVPPHPILGFYSASTGYVLNVSPRIDAGCRRFALEVRLVATKRLIEIASDLNSNPCMFRVALKHYRLHESAQNAALYESGRKLQSELQSFLSKHELIEQREIEGLVSEFMAKWIDDYVTEIAATEHAVDTPEEVLALLHACTL